MFRSAIKPLVVLLTLYHLTTAAVHKAEADMYGSGDDVQGVGQSRLYKVLNYQSATPTLDVIGNMGASVGDLAISDTGTMYAVITGAGDIRTVDVATGTLGSLVVSGIHTDANGLAWAPGNILYSYGFTSGAIQEVNLNTKQISLLTTLPGVGADLAFDPASGALYAVALNTNNLYKINPTTGTFSLQGSLALGGAAASIAVDATGQMYAMTSTQASATLRYYSVNKETAQTTLVADFTSSNVGNFGLAASPSISAGVPESGTFFTAVIMVVGIVFLRSGCKVGARAM